MRALIIITLLTGCDSYQMEMERRAKYCEEVKAGAWQEYDKSITCGEDNEKTNL